MRARVHEIGGSLGPTVTLVVGWPSGALKMPDIQAIKDIISLL